MKMILTGKLSDKFVNLVRLISIIIFLLTILPFPVSYGQQAEESQIKTPSAIKYNLGPQLISDRDTSPLFHYRQPRTLVTTCPNSDFSLGDFSNWDGCYGVFSGPNFQGKMDFRPCITAGFNSSRHVIMPVDGQTYDPLIGAPLTTVFPGETHSARLGDANGGGHAEQLKYTVNIGQDNYLFVYRWAAVLESYNHPAIEMPEFTIQVQTLTGDPLGDVCGFYEFVAPSCLPTDPGCVVPPEWTYKNAGITPGNDIHLYWHDWTTIALDLSAFEAFSPIQIVFTTRGCSHTAHRGYAYISTYCSALTIQTALCEGAPQAVLTAPPGFEAYLWNTGETTSSITITNPIDGAQFWVDVTSHSGACTAHISNTLHYTIITPEFTVGPACLGQPTQFTDGSTTNQNEIVDWDWDFGDLSAIQHEQNPTHVFTTAGTFTVTLTAHSTEGCTNVITHTVEVAELPIVDPIINQEYCNADIVTETTVSSITGPGTTFAWTNSLPAIGLPASGTGNIPGFTASNNTTDPVVASITITPTNGGCPGTPLIYTIKVNPTSIITSPSTANWCNNISNTYNILSSSTTPAPTYAWTRAAVPGISNLAGSGTGATITETLVNSTTDPIQVTYIITPTVNGCDGTPKNVLVTVNPTAEIISAPTVNWCNNVANTYSILSSSTTPAPTYAWTRAAVPGITNLAGSGTGASFTETLINSTTEPIIVTYVITPTVNGCSGTSKNIAITVNPTALVTSDLTANWCSNVSNTYNILSSTASVTPTYSWTRAVVPGITNAAGAGTGSSITETLVNTTTDPIIVPYVIVPAVNGCNGTPATINITVNPTAVVTSPAVANWCNNAANTYNILSSSTTPVPTYAWTRAVVAGITNAAGSGTGASITETLINSTTEPIIVQYIITPTVNGCDGTPKTVDVTVNPTAVVTSPALANWCNNVANTYNILSSSTTPVPTYGWTRPVVAGITNPAGAGSGDFITETLLNNTTEPIIVTYTITPTVNGCAGTPKDIAVTVNPTAVVTSAATANWCNNVPNTYNIISSSTMPTPAYAWSRAAVAGITNAAGSGSGATITETLVNSTTEPILVTYVIIPTVNGCDGITKSVDVTVNPTSVITSVPTANWCNNVPNTYNILSSSIAPTPSYAWSRAVVAGITNAAGSGTGDSFTETLENTTTDPIQVTYVITPTVNGCTGTPKNIIVTVNPTAVITSTATANWCNNVPNTYNILSSSTTPAPSYAWSRAVVPGITNAAGSGTGDSFTETLQNTTTDPILVTYVITPTVNGCDGTPKSITVTVNPTAVVTSASTVNWCNNIPNTYNILSSSTLPAPTYAWTRAAVPGIANIAGSGTGNSITETLLNTTTDPIQVTYVITPTVNMCEGTLKNVTVTVNPTAVITSVATANWCNNVPNTYNILSSSTSPAPTYAWSRAIVPGITNPAGAGTGDFITETLENTTTDPILVNYVIIPTVNGCDGTPKTIIVTVNPTSVITSPVSSNWCNNVANTYNILSSSTLPTPDYIWTRAAVPGITNAAGSGSGASITETLVNSTTDPIIVTYLITPFVNGCAGTQKAVDVTVNPTAVITSPATANWCSNIENTYNIISSSTSPTPSYAWTRAAVPGITNIDGSGTGAFITETLINTTVNPVLVNYIITPTVNGCDGTPKTVVVTVNPTAIITSPATANWCNNSSNTYNILSTSNNPVPTYIWSRAVVAGISNPAGSGTGASITETLVNTTTDPIIITYMITPTVNGCDGTTKSVLVTVNPTSIVTSSPTANWCNSIPNTYNILSSSSTPAPTYVWTRAAVPGISNPSGSGAGASITETLINTTTDPVVVQYLITPNVNGCDGTQKVIDVTVNPTSVITSANTANWCSSVSNTYTILSSSSAPTPSYSWTRAMVPGIANLAGSGTGATITETLVNSTTEPVTIHYLVTPSVNGCDGTQKSIAVTVNPISIITSSATGNWCHNISNTYNIQSSSSSPTPTYAWSRAVVAGITNPAGSGTGASITETLVNSTASPIVVTYVIIPTVNGCDGTPFNYAVTVNPLPIPHIFGAASVCTGTTGLIYHTEPAMSNYQWTISGGGSYTSGPGTNEITVHWFTIGPQTLTVNYVDGNNCTAVAPSSFTVNVQDLPNPTIEEGAQHVCVGNVVTYKTQTASSYVWGIPVLGGTYTGGTSTDNQLTMNWSNPGTYTITINYTVGSTGCTAVNPTSYTVVVNPNPTPVISGPIDPICGFSTKTYSTPGSGHIYEWTANGGALRAPTGLSSVTIDWGNTPPVSVDLTERIVYTGVTCYTNAANFPVSFKPWPIDPGSITGSASVCKTSTHTYSVAPILYATSHNWVYTGSGATITGNGNATITISFSAIATGGTLTVTGNNECGNGPTSQALVIAVNPLPVVSYSFCNDPVTTLNGKKFALKGGTPLLKGIPAQEGYSTINGPLGHNPIDLIGGVYYFNPSKLSNGETGSYPITYTYTNQYGCTSSATSQSITVVDPSMTFTSCGGLLTDPRMSPPNTYRTVWIGTQCWMAENLRYYKADASYTSTAYSTPQADNCKFERYCLLPGDLNCTVSGGFYQWDELMQYDGADRAQGFCPPGWHVPNALEWDNMITSVSGGIGNGVAGSFLKDLINNTSFKGDPDGIFYLNTLQSFTGPGIQSTFYWTSTYDAANKRALARGLNTITPSVSYYESSKINAFPVRCVKD
ncbi:MAG: PKD-like domain-containing protein [Bacteroidales bacterium]